MGVGSLAGLTCSVLTMALSGLPSSPHEKVSRAVRATGLSAVLGFLAAISPWASIPAGLAWSVGNFAVKLAHQRTQAAGLYRLSSPRALMASFQAVLQTCGPQRAFALLKGNTGPSVLLPYAEFLASHQAQISWPELHPQAAAFVNPQTPKQIP